MRIFLTVLFGLSLVASGAAQDCPHGASRAECPECAHRALITKKQKGVDKQIDKLENVMLNLIDQLRSRGQEHYAGNLPLWLAPSQVKVLTITSDADEHAASVAARLRDAGLTAEADLRNEKISFKVREHSVAKVPVLMAVGQREVSEDTVAVRRLGSKQQTVVKVDDAIAQLASEIQQRA